MKQLIDPIDYYPHPSDTMNYQKEKKEFEKLMKKLKNKKPRNHVQEIRGF